MTRATRIEGMIIKALTEMRIAQDQVQRLANKVSTMERYLAQAEAVEQAQQIIQGRA